MTNESSEYISEIKDEMREMIIQEEFIKFENDYAAWIKGLDCLSQDYTVKPNSDFLPDIDLWPTAWFRRAIEIVSKGMNKNGGYIEYPLFSLACKFFLKGMWLCHFKNCREIAFDGYMESAERDSINQCLKS